MGKSGQKNADRKNADRKQKQREKIAADNDNNKKMWLIWTYKLRF